MERTENNMESVSKIDMQVLRYVIRTQNKRSCLTSEAVKRRAWKEAQILLNLWILLEYTPRSGREERGGRPWHRCRRSTPPRTPYSTRNRTRPRKPDWASLDHGIGLRHFSDVILNKLARAARKIFKSTINFS